MARMQGRLDSTEQRQQQMMAMLAKAVHNPIFLQQLLNSNRPPVHRLDSGEGTNGGSGGVGSCLSAGEECLQDDCLFCTDMAALAMTCIPVAVTCPGAAQTLPGAVCPGPSAL